LSRLKQLGRLVLAALLVFIFGNGVGYLIRIADCRGEMRTIWVTAPGDDDGPELYRIEVSACALPEQWGGRKGPLEGYP